MLIWPGIRLWRRYARLPLTSKLGLTVVRSRSRENNTQLFSNTLAPLRYALCTAYVNRHPATPKACRTEFKSKAYISKGKKKWDSTKVWPGIRLRRRYPHSTPGEQAPRSPSGVCAPASLRYARRKVGTKCDLRHQNKKGHSLRVSFCFGGAGRI